MGKPWLTPQTLPQVALDWLTTYTGSPERIAFEARKRFDANTTAAIVEQARGLHKARTKLPTLASHPGLLFPPVSVEQATPEPIARGKFEHLAGDLAVDLTAGLGVDAWQLAQRFRQVVACEHEPALAEVLRHNFGTVWPQPGLSVEQTDGLAYLAGQDRLPDLVYLDPARRNPGGRVVRWAELQPDPVACWPGLLQATRRWLILKLSPLTDLAEALRVFPEATAVTCRSLDGEVKEVAVVVDKHSDQKGQVTAEVFTPGNRRIFQLPEDPVPARREAQVVSPEQLTGHWLWVPDAALRHSRLATPLALQQEPACAVLNQGAYFVFQDRHPHLAGSWWGVRAVLPKNQVPDWLKAHGIRQALVHALRLPVRPEQLAHKWKIRQGGSIHLVVVHAHGHDWVVVCY
jgi:hypothetical protein